MYKRINSFFKSRLEIMIKRTVDNYLVQYLAQGYFDERIKEVMLNQHLVFGDPKKLNLSETCIVNNATFNLSSGNIVIEDYVFFGHNVSLITGTHNYNKFGIDRRNDFPKQGNDIIVEEGAWIASNATVLGPCRIGKHSVIGAGAVVKGDIPSYHIVAGIPAKTIKDIKPLTEKN
ncbi:MAG: acyltransferase [Brasilonema angustatum HA4187-MV1]|nr:acyltransferase [Brasilonema angustatum HA4187-MV1]